MHDKGKRMKGPLPRHHALPPLHKTMPTLGKVVDFPLKQLFLEAWGYHLKHLDSLILLQYQMDASLVTKKIIVRMVQTAQDLC